MFLPKSVFALVICFAPVLSRSHRFARYKQHMIIGKTGFIEATIRALDYLEQTNYFVLVCDNLQIIHQSNRLGSLWPHKSQSIYNVGFAAWHLGPVFYGGFLARMAYNNTFFKQGMIAYGITTYKQCDAFHLVVLMQLGVDKRLVEHVRCRMSESRRVPQNDDWLSWWIAYFKHKW